MALGTETHFGLVEFSLKLALFVGGGYNGSDMRAR